jgi:DNA-binding phage protein
MDIQKKIKYAMLEAGDISDSELARRMGTTRQNIHRKLQPGAPPWTVADLKRVADACGADLQVNFVFPDGRTI